MYEPSESIALHSLPSSRWSLDTVDITRAEESFTVTTPTRPPRAQLPKWLSRYRQATTRRSYDIGDPIFLRDSLTPYTFRGLTSRSTIDVGSRRDARTQEAIFRAPGEFPPFKEFTIRLRPKVGHSQRRPLTRTSAWMAFGEKLRGWLCCARRDDMH